jgi:hypothetical protein
LDSGLDGVDGGVRKGTHGAGDEAEEHGLVRWERVGRREGGLEFVGELFELLGRRTREGGKRSADEEKKDSREKARTLMGKGSDVLGTQ